MAQSITKYNHNTKNNKKNTNTHSNYYQADYLRLIDARSDLKANS